MFTRRNDNSNRKREFSSIVDILSVGLLSVMLITSTASAGKLLVRSYNGHDWDLYIMNEDGTSLRAVDTSPNNVCHGEFSPDGKTILYVAETTPPYYSIYQVSVHGGTPSVVPGFADVFSVSRPAWGVFPDRFYVGVCVGGSCGNYDMEIHRLTYTLAADGFLDRCKRSTKYTRNADGTVIGSSVYRSSRAASNTQERRSSDQYCGMPWLMHGDYQKHRRRSMWHNSDRSEPSHQI